MGDETMDVRELTVQCPACGAPAGHPCNAPAEGAAAAEVCADRAEAVGALGQRDEPDAERLCAEEVIDRAVFESDGARFLPDEAQAFIVDDVARALREAHMLREEADDA